MADERHVVRANALPSPMGMSWKVPLAEPWELGGEKGMQKVHVDPSTATVTLMREGSSQGFFLQQPKQISLVKSGKTETLDRTNLAERSSCGKPRRNASRLHRTELVLLSSISSRPSLGRR
jgi:hypothetical protein